MVVILFFCSIVIDFESKCDHNFSHASRFGSKHDDVGRLLHHFVNKIHASQKMSPTDCDDLLTCYQSSPAVQGFSFIQ